MDVYILLYMYLYKKTIFFLTRLSIFPSKYNTEFTTQLTNSYSVVYKNDFVLYNNS